MATTTTTDKPTSRQLSYLKSLANRTGQTFTYPQTSRQANAEINRLKHTHPTTRTERYVERKLIADQIATGPMDAARVREDEISGSGSSATWMHNRDQDPAPVEDPGHATPRRRRAPVVGKRTELARYTVAEGERILYGQRIDGSVRFLPGEQVALVPAWARTEDGICRCRRLSTAGGRAHAVRQKRHSDPSACVGAHSDGWDVQS
jgi:hypothetical protein